MAYSDDALRFSVIPVSDQVRLTDRISFVYLEHTRIVQSDTGVVAFDENGARRIAIPASSLAVVLLGPGTSVTHAAISSMAACGATVLWTGTDGHRLHAAGVPLTSSAKWAQAQARTFADRSAREQAARYLYGTRFGDAQIGEGTSIATMRALEGAQVKATYRSLASKHRVTKFKRDSKGSDPVNICLNVANSLLYGLAASICAALTLNPALGIIHEGDANAFLFDLADLYKLDTSVPLAFACASDPNPIPLIRRRMRSAIVKEKIMVRMFQATMTLLEPQVSKEIGDRLIDDAHQSVPGHFNYAQEV